MRRTVSALGPVQVLVVGLERSGAEAELLAELQRLREGSAVRIVDLLVVHRQRNGSVVELRQDERADADEERPGSIVGGLLGIGVGAAAAAPWAPPDNESWYLADQIPLGTTAAIALLEHRWAIPLRETIAGLEGEILGDAWIHPRDLGAEPA